MGIWADGVFRAAVDQETDDATRRILRRAWKRRHRFRGEGRTLESRAVLIQSVYRRYLVLRSQYHRMAMKRPHCRKGQRRRRTDAKAAATCVGWRQSTSRGCTGGATQGGPWGGSRTPTLSTSMRNSKKFWWLATTAMAVTVAPTAMTVARPQVGEGGQIFFLAPRRRSSSGSGKCRGVGGGRQTWRFAQWRPTGGWYPREGWHSSMGAHRRTGRGPKGKSTGRRQSRSARPARRI
mmetsp:Transcript_30059/g.59465  ORF Transcript_30059/g.59465 Transcript_30059/m.59465 type:complete len:236 (+) Transcript_30059:941-1648(+)